jgi:hypothetical protein
MAVLFLIIRFTQLPLPIVPPVEMIGTGVPFTATDTPPVYIPPPQSIANNPVLYGTAGDDVGVIVGVGVIVAVLVGVGVLVFVGVVVGVVVFVGVLVMVAVIEGVGVGVDVLVGVGVLLGVIDGVGDGASGNKIGGTCPP